MERNKTIIILLLSALCTSVIAQSDDILLDSVSIDTSSMSAETAESPSALPAFPNGTFDQMLQGNFAGVHAVQASGQPGAQMMIQIRGMRSLAGGNEPLYIIDGFPLYNDNGLAISGLTLGPALNALSAWHPEDIQSIKVLKDATAAAFYGARGANGVVLVETKRGQVGAPMLEIGVQLGSMSSLTSPQLLSGTDYATFLNQANSAGGRPGQINSPAAFGAGTDWTNIIQDNSALMHTYRVGVSGGSENMAFRIQGTYSIKQGNLQGSDLNRFILHANVDARATKSIKVRNSLNIARLDANTIATDDNGSGEQLGVITATQIFSPLLSSILTAEDANYFNVRVDDEGNPTPELQSSQAYVNPLALSTAIDSRLVNTRFSDYFGIDVSLLEGLTLTGGLGADALFNEESLFIPGALEFQKSPGGTGGGSRMQSIEWISDLRLKYKRQFGSQHNLSALIGYALQGYRREILGGTSRGFENQTLRFNDLSVGSGKFITSDRLENSWRSLMASVDYTFDDRLQILLTMRSDASSKNGGEAMLFPAVGLKWTVSKEGFLVRLRLSAGQTGSFAIPSYQQFTVIDEVSSSLNGVTINGLNRVRLGAEDLKFETTRKINLGLDIGLFADDLFLRADYYNEVTDNALTFVPLAGQTGYDLTLANIAEVANRGFEVSLVTRRFGQKVQWNGQWHLSANKNEIKNLGATNNITVGSEVLGRDEWSILREGESIGAFYGYQSELRDGVINYRDLDGDGQITRADRTIIGNAAPTLVFGFSNTLNYKGIELHFMLQGSSGSDIANFNSLLIGNPNGQSNIRTDVLSTQNPNADLDLLFSDHLIEDGTYLRLKRLRVAYQLPKSLVEKWSMGSIKIYASMENIWTGTKYSGVDPDVSHFGQQHLFQGVDFGGYPKAHQIVGGIQVQL